MPCLATILITLSLTVPAMSVELFRYRGAAKDGGTLEYVFEAGVALYLNRDRQKPGGQVDGRGHRFKPRLGSG